MKINIFVLKGDLNGKIVVVRFFFCRVYTLTFLRNKCKFQVILMSYNENIEHECSCFTVLCTSHCLWEFCVGLCFGMHYFMPFLVLQSSWWGRESRLLCFYCLLDVLLLFCCSSSWCRGLDCSVSLWICLIILTYLMSDPVLQN